MGRSSLYHYYPDKNALLGDLVREMFRVERALFRACLRSAGSPLDRLLSLARACAGLFPEWADFGRLILDLRLEDAKFLKTYFRDLRRETAAVIAEGQADGSLLPDPPADVSASVLIGAIDGLLLQYFLEPRALPNPEELAEVLCVMTRRLVAP
jgi:AcrR family transcriptional regulator